VQGLFQRQIGKTSARSGDKHGQLLNKELDNLGMQGGLRITNHH
jgi:hypothetical protein